MIVHVIPETEYCNDYIDFVNEYYKSEEHKFCIIKTYEQSILREYKDDVDWEYWSSNLLWKIKKVSSKARLIIFHGLFNWQFMVWIAMHFHKKIYISIWGGELYDHIKIEENRFSMQEYVIDKIKKCAFQRASLFINDMAEDYYYLKKWYNVKSPSVHAIYPQALKLDKLEVIRKSKRKTTKYVKIIIGNSATDSNNHIEVLKRLSVFKDKEIEIYCPLSYGDDTYRKYVIETGIDLLGDKFIPITSYMNVDEYVMFLSNMDIGIFNNNRQQAMANIALLGYLGAKLYLRSDTTMWEQYVNKGNCCISEMSSLYNASFDEFTTNSEVSKRSNYLYFKNLWDDEYIKEMWDKILL